MSILRPLSVATAVAVLVATADGRLAPYAPNWPYRLTATALVAYVNKTFGPAQQCLKVAADDTAEAAAILAMLYGHEPWPAGVYGRVTTARTIEAQDESSAPDNRASHCAAYVVIGRRLAIVDGYLEKFRNGAAQRMLVIIVQSKKYIQPFLKYSPEYFNYKDVILISVHPQMESVYRMSIYHKKFVLLSKQHDRWFRHDLEGKQKVKNFHETRVKLMAFNNTLFSNVINNSATGKLSLANGVECIIFKEIAKQMNITWDVYTSNDGDKWGTAHSNNTVTGGALKWLFMKRVDVAFCSLWIEGTRLKHVDMSRFWALMCLTFLVPKPQPLRDKWDLLYKPFPLSLWLLVVFSATLTIITARIMAGVQKRIGYEKINAFTSLSSTIFWIVGIMLLTNNPRTNRMGPIRHLINWWCIFTFIMTTLFSSILYSYITSPEYTDIVLEVEDMVKANYHWGLTYPPPFDFIFKMQNPVHRAFMKNFVPERNIGDRVRRLKRGKYATLAKCLYEKHFMETENVPAAILNDLRTARTCMNQLYIGFGFAKHSPYVKPANLVIQRIFEGGLIDYWLSRVTAAHISPATFKQVYEIKPHSRKGNGDRPSALSYRQFKAVMTVWTAGCAISTAVFVVERQWARRYRHPPRY